MDSINGYDPTLPLGVLDGSTNPDLLTEVTFGSHLELSDGSVPMVAKAGSGRMSPVRARTMKEYDQQISILKKENFSLKLRIYFLEERMQQKFGDGEDVFKTNIQLKVECESLKKELEDKHDLLKKASNAMENLSSNHQVELAQVKSQVENETKKGQNNLIEQLEAARSRVDETERLLLEKDEDIQDLQEKLNQLNSEMKLLEQKGDNSVKELMQELKEKAGALQSLTDSNKALMEDNSRLMSQKCEAEHQLQQLSKELDRRDRDLEHLSCIVQDTTTLDSESFLVNNHMQDVVDDQLEKIEQLQNELEKQGQKVKGQEEVIGKLEDFLRAKENEKKEAEEALKRAEEGLQEERTKTDIRDNTIRGLKKAVTEKAQEMEELAEKLKQQEDESKKLQEEFHKMALQRQKSAEQHYEAVDLLEQQLAGVQSQLKQREAELENLMKSLGKKEGELEGFKELLDKAQHQLQRSEESVEELTDQLKKQQRSPLQSSRSSQHYKDLYEDSQQLLRDKEDLIHQLNEALKDKDRQLHKSMDIFTDQTDGVQEKDEEDVLRRRSLDPQFSRAQREELDYLRSEVTLLRDHVKNKDELISKLQSLLHQSGDSDQGSKIQELLIELATKTEALKAARNMEQDLRQQLQELKERLKSLPHSDKEFHRLEKEVIYLKDQNSSPPDGSTGVDGQVLQETLKAQLEELRKLTSSVEAERDILKNIIDRSSGESSRVLEEELAAVQSLRHELEQGIGRNSQMRAALETQIKDVNTADPVETEDLKKCLSYVKLELEASRINNALLQTKINDLQYRTRVEGVGRAQSSHQSAQTSPGKFSPGHRSPDNRSPSPLDSSIPLNRQSLSDMSAPMLRRLIRQLQHQLDQAEKEIAELRQRHHAMVDRIRDIPGKNDDDVNCIPYLKAELDTLKRKLELKDEEILEMQSRYIPGSEVQISKSDTAVQTSPWSTAGVVPSHKDFMLKGHQACKKGSQIPRLKKAAPQPLTTDLSDITQPDTLKTLLLESKKRITELEDKLKATEGTVHHQAQKMKHYRGLLQEHGLSSPVCSRSSSESNLPALLANGKPALRTLSASQDNFPSLVHSSEDLQFGISDKFGDGYNSQELREQVQQLKDRLQMQQMEIRILREKVKQGNTTSSLEQNVQTLSSMDDTLVSRNTLNDLRQQVDTLQRHLQETRDTNAELQHKLLQQQHTQNEISDLRQQLADSRRVVVGLEDQLTAIQSSSVQQVITSQKSEIIFLKKKLADAHNSCLQIDKWLAEVSVFLSHLMYEDQDTDTASGQVRGIKQRVDHSRDVVRTLSSSMLLDEETGPEAMTDEYKRSVAQKEAAVYNQARLTEELKLKNQEVERLTSELKKKNSLVENLSRELHVFQSRFSKSDSPKSSSSSATDGNVSVTPKHLSKSHRTSIGTNATQEISGLDETVGTTVFGSASPRSHDLSLERMRHMTGSSVMDGSRLRLQQSVDDVEIQEDAADSSQASTGYHSSRLSGDEINSSAPGHDTEGSFSLNKDVSHYTNLLDTDERLLYNRRLTDDHLFDSSPTCLGFSSESTLSKTQRRTRSRSSGHHVDFSVMDASSHNGVLNITAAEEVDILKARLNTVEDLNKTLKDELNVYENLCKSIGVQSSPTKRSPDTSANESNTDILKQNLAELRALRIKLEHSLKDSDRLRQRLEKDMDSNTTDSTTTNVYMYSKQQTTITNLQQTVQRLQQTIKRLQQELQDKENAIQEAKRKSEEKDHSIKEWTERTTYSKQQTTITDLQQTVQRLQQTIKQLQQELRDKENSVQEAKIKSEEKDLSIKEWMEKTKAGEQTLIVQQRRIQQQDDTLVQLRKQIQSQENSLQQQKVHITKLEQTIIEKEDIVSHRDRSIQRQAEQIKQLVLTIRKQGEQVKKHEHTISEQGNRIKEMEDSINSQGEKIKAKETTVIKQEKQIRTLHDKLKQQEVGKKEKDLANQKLMEQIERLGEDNKKLETQKERLSQDNEKLVQRNSRLNQELKRADKEISRLQHNVEVTEEKVEESKHMNQTLRLELSVYEKLEAEKENLKPRKSTGAVGGFDIRELLTEIKHLRVQLERCIDTNNALREKLEEHLAHQTSPQQIKTTNIYHVKDLSPARSQGTDAPDGQPSPERPYSQTPGFMTPEKGQGSRKGQHLRLGGEGSATSSSQDATSDTVSVSTPSDIPSSASSGVVTWPVVGRDITQENEVHASLSTPGGPVQRCSNLYNRTKMIRSEGNLSYHVDDPPGLLADYTAHRVDSDMRCLFAIGKLDDYEKLRKENTECGVTLKGIEARIQGRLEAFRNVSVRESVEYSTLKELSRSADNLRICLNEEHSLIECFWTAQLPREDFESSMIAENNSLRCELLGAQSKCNLLSKKVQDTEKKLHASNKKLDSMEEYMYKELSITAGVMTQARSNLERQAMQAGVLGPKVCYKKSSKPSDADNGEDHS